MSDRDAPISPYGILKESREQRRDMPLREKGETGGTITALLKYARESGRRGMDPE